MYAIHRYLLIALLALSAPACIFTEGKVSPGQPEDMGVDMTTPDMPGDMPGDMPTPDMPAPDMPQKPTVSLFISASEGTEGDNIPVSVSVTVEGGDAPVTVTLNTTGRDQTLTIDDVHVEGDANDTLLRPLLSQGQVEVELQPNTTTTLFAFTLLDDERVEGDESLNIDLAPGDLYQTGAASITFTARDTGASRRRTHTIPLRLSIPESAREGLKQLNGALHVPITLPLSMISDDAFWNTVQPDGRDLFVRDERGQCVPLDLSGFKRNARRGELHMLAAIPPGVGGSIMLHLDFGSTGAPWPVTPPESACGSHRVWEDYLAVWHMNVTPDNKLKDSTAQNLHLAFVRGGTTGASQPTVEETRYSDGLRFNNASYYFELEQVAALHEQEGLVLLAAYRATAPTGALTGEAIAERQYGTIFQVVRPALAQEPDMSHLLLSAIYSKGADADAGELRLDGYASANPTPTKRPIHTTGIYNDNPLDWKVSRLAIRHSQNMLRMWYHQEKVEATGVANGAKVLLNDGTLRVGVANTNRIGANALLSDFNGVIDELRLRPTRQPNGETFVDPFDVFETLSVYNPEVFWNNASLIVSPL